VALGIIILVFLTLAFGIVAIHDIPYNIAKRAISRIKMPSIQRYALASSPFTPSGRSSGSGRPPITPSMAMLVGQNNAFQMTLPPG
jgi:hypothetical protein